MKKYTVQHSLLNDPVTGDKMLEVREEGDHDIIWFDFHDNPFINFAINIGFLLLLALFFCVLGAICLGILWIFSSLF